MRPTPESPELRFVERPPTPAEYAALRAAVGWPEVSADQVETGLANALYSVCLEDDSGTAVGCARVVGDGGIYLYLQDVIVRPDLQGVGLGRELTRRVMAYVAASAGDNTFVGLMAAEGVAGFYHRFGFAERPAGRPGMYRMWRSDVDAGSAEPGHS